MQRKLLDYFTVTLDSDEVPEKIIEERLPPSYRHDRSPLEKKRIKEAAAPSNSSRLQKSGRR